MKYKFSRKLLAKVYGQYDNEKDFIEDLLATVSPEEESQKIMMEQFLSDQIDIAYSKGREESIKIVKKWVKDEEILSYVVDDTIPILIEALSIQSKENK